MERWAWRSATSYLRRPDAAARDRRASSKRGWRPGRRGADIWLFVDGVLWAARSRETLPERQGKWKSVHKRLSHWATNGVTEWICDSLSADPGDGYLMLETTLGRAHTATHPTLREPSNTFSRMLRIPGRFMTPSGELSSNWASPCLYSRNIGPAMGIIST